jgi:formate hydrogenlyase subunit 3/multisubunit Na+/H+ antiporter MnhD subunit
MSDTLIIWIVAVPLLVGLAAWLLRSRTDARAPAMLTLCFGLLVEMLLSILASGSISLPTIGLELAISPPARLGLLAVNAALLCAVFYSWYSDEQASDGLLIWPAALTSGLLAGALLSQERIVSAVCILGVALSLSGAAFGTQGAALGINEEDEEGRTWLARRIAGGLKHLALAIIGVGLMVAGALLLARYSVNLENRALAQLGTGFLAMGLLIRAGAMPFSSAANDLVETTPGVAMQMLGAATPGVLIVGLLMLAPVQSSQVNPESAAWLAAISALLAGVRALSAGGETAKGESGDRNQTIATLVAATIALQAAWALFGLLSGSRSGVMGALLLAANMSLAIPLLIAGSRWMARNTWGRVGVAVAAMSLLGLPPFGGFAGTLMVAQAAANLSGLWLGVLLIGSALVAAAWLQARNRLVAGAEEASSGGNSGNGGNGFGLPVVFIGVLIGSQVGLLMLSGRILDALAAWANVPWLSTP